MDTQKVVLVVDLGEETRWGDYRLRAISQGVRASLSVPIPGTTDATGALNLYSRTPGRSAPSTSNGRNASPTKPPGRCNWPPGSPNKPP
jgi:hypothetical protein